MKYALSLNNNDDCANKSAYSLKCLVSKDGKVNRQKQQCDYNEYDLVNICQKPDHIFLNYCHL